MIPQDYPRVIIEAVQPQIDCGRFPIKRVVGETVTVTADIYKEGHDKLAAVVKYRRLGESLWQESPMAFWDNDRWRGEFMVDALGRWEYTVEAYAERYLSWVDEITKKNVPGASLTSELLEGLVILKTSASLGARRRSGAHERPGRRDRGRDGSRRAGWAQSIWPPEA